MRTRTLAQRMIEEKYNFSYEKERGPSWQQMKRGPTTSLEIAILTHQDPMNRSFSSDIQKMKEEPGIARKRATKSRRAVTVTLSSSAAGRRLLAKN